MILTRPCSQQASMKSEESGSGDIQQSSYAVYPSDIGFSICANWPVDVLNMQSSRFSTLTARNASSALKINLKEPKDFEGQATVK